MTVQLEESTLFQEAKEFVQTYYEELKLPQNELQDRLDEIHQEIMDTGSYTHTSLELNYGAKMAWRNSNRCIGRLLWDTLHVFDCREVESAEDAYHHLLNHIEYATNGGKIRSTISVFPPRKHQEDRLRIYNHQLIRYAAYQVGDKIIGDPTSLEMTQLCERLGWQGKGTAYDVLPLLIQDEKKDLQLFEIPSDLIKEVAIIHPQIEGFEELQMQWYAVPIISDMRLEIGGISYPMAPFNGWYMGTEIGARNLADEDRYHFLPEIAEVMGLDQQSHRSLWKDKALVELNLAILHSYLKAGVTLVDHHTAARQFKQFERKEEASGRKVTGDWTWLIPPISPATTHIYRKSYNNTIVKPNYFYQKDLW